MARPGNYKGRPKGSKNLKTVEKLRGLQIVAADVAKVLAELPKPKALRLKADAGISPKDLLLIAMRDCWAAADALEAEAAGCRASAEGFPVMPPDPDSGKLSERDLLLERARYLMTARDAQLGRATELAKDVAPYEHAKLANLNAKLVGDVLLTIKKYAP